MTTGLLAGSLSLLVSTSSPAAEQRASVAARSETAAVASGAGKLARPPRADRARGYVQPTGKQPSDVTLFVPRLLLAVPRLAWRLTAWPVVKTMELVDRYAIVQEVTDILYNDERTAGVVPQFSAESFFGLSLGAKAFHENLAGHGEYGSIQGRVGGRYDSVTQLTFRANRFGGSRLWLESVSRYESQPRMLFQGIGAPEERRADGLLGPRDGAVETRFHQRRWLALLRSGYTFSLTGGLLQLGASGVYNVREFGPKTSGDGASIEQVYDTAQLIGFRRRVAIFESDLNLQLDTRDVAGATSSGAYVEGFAGHARGNDGFEFWHHGLEAVGYFDLYHRTRVLVLRGVVEGVEGRASAIPFSELPRLGGPHRLRGYPLDRFRDEKALLGTLEYHYPIHQFVSGALYVDVGRVERSYVDFISANGWKAGAGGGLIFRSRDKLSFAFDVAYGDGLQFLLTTDPLRAFTNKDTEL